MGYLNCVFWLCIRLLEHAETLNVTQPTPSLKTTGSGLLTPDLVYSCTPNAMHQCHWILFILLDRHRNVTDNLEHRFCEKCILSSKHLVIYSCYF